MKNPVQKLFVLILGLLLVACSAVATRPAAEPNVVPAPVPLTKVSVALDWFPWSNHAGLYVARERGYFAEEGLEVEIFTPGDPSTVLQTVASGRDDFGISYQTDLLIARQQDVPVVSVMALVQHPLNSVMALESSGISTPADLAGKKIGSPAIPSDELLLSTMLKSEGKTIADIELINVGFSLVPALISGEVDAIIGAYWVHESISAVNQGFPVNIMRLEEHGVPDFYELVMVANEDMIAENPDLIQRFVRGVRRGYQDAIDDPRGAVQLLKDVRPEVDLTIENPGVDLLAPLWEPDGGQGFGWQEEARWVDYAQWMEESGLLDGGLDATAAFDNSFVANAAR
ncbi:MAG: ABC transporter substrate-binding protein [Chloroflexi bacterium]|nr:ABC transporter substrate-binding protein [Chloroflexota bacterium]MDA1218029.1 ABC transporter substrate-binding protein [Chloroflexota bacterium]PKB57306.1 MAG: pyrimidine biosynthesis enzyme [SAR202 cluster bacterium Casp-Chloro-G3]